MDPISRQLGTKQPVHGRRARRSRPTLSCSHCRFRKLKCNRGTPCETCVKAGDAATCTYGRDEDQHSTKFIDRDAMISRIDRLENLLQAVMSDTSHRSSYTPSSDSILISNVSEGEHPTQTQKGNGSEAVEMELLGKEFGHLRIEPTPTYHGGNHWISGMLQIEEFRNYLEANSDDLGRIAVENKKASEDNENATSLLRGTNIALTKDELLSYVPSRVITDMLITRFFNNVAQSIPILHEETFREEYVEHWKHPNQTTIPWLALLFSILHHAELSLDIYGEDRFQSSAKEYRRRMIQCLIAANYTDPQLYTVEALILHSFAEWMSSQDSSVEVSLLIGIVIRLAMRMGMHRDSSAYHSVTPFQGEMRRRVWAIIRAMDIIGAFQLSLPATIHHSHSRCAVPRNIFNDELSKNIVELPPPRPLSEATEISGAIIKTHLVLELGKIVAFAQVEDNPTLEEISKYEQSLEEVRKMIPEHLNISSVSEQTQVTQELQRQRIDVDRVYKTSQCVLHRYSLSQARHDSSKLQHRGVCIDAAMALLAHQATLYLDPSSPYPQNIRKRHLHALTTHDFFTAAMAVALDIHYGFESEPFTPSPSDVMLWGYDRRNEMITALETSTEFCRVSKEESVEAANAYGMLCYVVAKARKAQWMIAEQQVRGNTSTSSTLVSDLDTAAPVTQFDTELLGTEIFNGPLPDFNWNLWNQFNNSNQNFQLLEEWEESVSNPILTNERPF